MLVAFLALASLAGAFLFLGGGADPSLPSYYTDPTPTWLRGNPETGPVTGRVTTPAGEPVAGADVQLIYEGDPHWPRSVAYRAVTDADGVFHIEDAAQMGFPIVVSGNGGVRTYRPSGAGGFPYPDPLVITVGPVYPVPVFVACSERVPAARRPGTNVSVHVTAWTLPEGEFFSDAYLRATDDAPLGPPEGDPALRPERPRYLPRIPRDARHLASYLYLPPGSYRLSVSDACGTASREIEVAATDAQEGVHFALPQADHSELVLRMAEDSTRARLRPAVYFGSARVNPYDAVSPRHPLRYPQLAPGDYEVRDVTCHRPITIPPSSVTRVTIGPGRCDVHSWRRPDAPELPEQEGQEEEQEELPANPEAD